MHRHIGRNDAFFQNNVTVNICKVSVLNKIDADKFHCAVRGICLSKGAVPIHTVKPSAHEGAHSRRLGRCEVDDKAFVSNNINH